MNQQQVSRPGLVLLLSPCLCMRLLATGRVPDNSRIALFLAKLYFREDRKASACTTVRAMYWLGLLHAVFTVNAMYWLILLPQLCFFSFAAVYLAAYASMVHCMCMWVRIYDRALQMDAVEVCESVIATLDTTSTSAGYSASVVQDIADAFYIIGWIQIHAGNHTRGYSTWYVRARLLDCASARGPSACFTSKVCSSIQYHNIL